MKRKMFFTPLRVKRIAAFFIDIVIVGILLYFSYKLFGFPDFYKVREVMIQTNAANAAGDTKAASDLVNQSLMLFNRAWFGALCIWGGYEICTQSILGGATIGKLILGLYIVPVNPDRSVVMQIIILGLRSITKVLLAYLAQGIPFLLTALAMFANEESRTGYDTLFKVKLSERSDMVLSRKMSKAAVGRAR